MLVVIESGNKIKIALPDEFVVIVKDVTLEYNPVLVPLSDGNLCLQYSGAKTDKIL